MRLIRVIRKLARVIRKLTRVIRRLARVIRKLARVIRKLAALYATRRLILVVFHICLIRATCLAHQVFPVLLLQTIHGEEFK